MGKRPAARGLRLPSTRTRSNDTGKAPTVLVVGASGFLGRSVVRALARHGFAVRGLVRDAQRAAPVREDGGTPTIGDVLDRRSLGAAANGCDGIIHLAANPSTGQDPARVRVEGTRNLVEAALSGNVPRLVVGSGYWVYRGQADPIDEGSAVDPQGESKTNYDAEREGLASNAPGRLDVLVVRPGMVYGNGSWFRDMANSIRARAYRVVGPGTNRWSFIDHEDAGSAFRTVFEAGIPGKIYNAVDGSPGSLREFADFVAAGLGVPAPLSTSVEDAAREMGEAVARHLAADRPTASRQLAGLGWIPRFPSYRVGLPRVLREMFPP